LRVISHVGSGYYCRWLLWQDYPDFLVTIPPTFRTGTCFWSRPTVAADPWFEELRFGLTAVVIATDQLARSSAAFFVLLRQGKWRASFGSFLAPGGFVKFKGAPKGFRKAYSGFFASLATQHFPLSEISAGELLMEESSDL